MDEYEVQEYNNASVSISYQFGQNQNTSTKELFVVGSSFPLTKTITFDNKLGGIELLIHYS